LAAAVGPIGSSDPAEERYVALSGGTPSGAAATAVVDKI
jgi:hypothetical protein